MHVPVVKVRCIEFIGAKQALGWAGQNSVWSLGLPPNPLEPVHVLPIQFLIQTLIHTQSIPAYPDRGSLWTTAGVLGHGILGQELLAKPAWPPDAQDLVQVVPLHMLEEVVSASKSLAAVIADFLLPAGSQTTLPVIFKLVLLREIYLTLVTGQPDILDVIQVILGHVFIVLEWRLKRLVAGQAVGGWIKGTC